MRIVTADDQSRVIDHVMTMPGGQTVIVLRDGTSLELSDGDVEVLEMSFESECENCGFNPNDNWPDDSADSPYEDDQVHGGEEDDDDDEP